MPSREFNQLKRNTVQLKAEFLGFSKRTDGRYTRSELMRCRAFIAFTHAEVEHYLELIALKVLDRAEAKWDDRETVSKVVAGLLAFRQPRDIDVPGNPMQQADNKKLPSLIKEAFARQRSIVSANNGLKAKNLSELYIPLGIKPEDIEEALVIQLENFGSLRGGLVHNNAEVSLPRLRDPFDDEYRDVEYLIDELERFDQLAQRL